MIGAVIFDMDGVIVDSTELDFAAWKQVFSEFGIKLSFETYKSFLGMKGKEVVKKLIRPDMSEAATKFWQDKKEQYFIESIRKDCLKPVKGLMNFLNRLKKHNYRLALATAGSQGKVAAVLKKLKLEKYFTVIVTADDVVEGKPSPETFLKAAKKLKCSSRECIVIEDAPNGIKAAKAGRMLCIALTTTHKRHELTGADKIIDSFSELTTEALKALQ